jgi:hypothetical protein
MERLLAALLFTALAGVAALAAVAAVGVVEVMLHGALPGFPYGRQPPLSGWSVAAGTIVGVGALAAAACAAIRAAGVARPGVRDHLEQCALLYLAGMLLVLSRRSAMAPLIGGGPLQGVPLLIVAAVVVNAATLLALRARSATPADQQAGVC